MTHNMRTKKRRNCPFGLEEEEKDNSLSWNLWSYFNFM